MSAKGLSGMIIIITDYELKHQTAMTKQHKCHVGLCCFVTLLCDVRSKLSASTICNLRKQ